MSVEVTKEYVATVVQEAIAKALSNAALVKSEPAVETDSESLQDNESEVIDSVQQPAESDTLMDRLENLGNVEVCGAESDRGDNEVEDEGDLDQTLIELKQSMETEEIGEELSSCLAEVSNLLITKGLPEQEGRNTAKKYLTPSNCKVMVAPRVNKFIWGAMSQKARREDIAKQQSQLFVVKSMTSLTSAMDDVKKMLNTTPALKSCFKKLTDSLKLMSVVNKDMNQKRREGIKKELNEAYQQICSPSIPVSEHLFGDDVEELMKQQADTNRLRDQVIRQQNGLKGVARGRVTKNWKKAGSFLQGQKSHLSQNQSQSNRGFHRGQSQPRGRGRGFSTRGRH